ncbi:MAG: helix-hairpin-helix domain-containing protein [Nitrososphaera sp.]
MINPEVAKVMRDLGFLTEVGDDDPNAQFRARAYYRAADTIASLPQDVADIYGKSGVKGLLEIPSVGKAIAAKIEEYVKTGKVRALEDMKAKVPINVDELYGLEGIGPKTIRALYDRLKIKSLADLEKAASEGRLRAVPGFTEKKEQDILKKIEFFKKGKGRRIIGEVYPLVKRIEKGLSQVAGVKDAVAAGSVRRMKETIGDIDYLVAASDPEPVMDFFTKMQEVQEVIGRGPAKAFVRLSGGIDADLLVVPEESWGSALQYFTGSKEHSVELRKIAIAKGLRLNEWGVFKGEKRVAGATEEEVYRALGLQWVPPEMRENAGEIELARHNRIPELVEYGSLKGDLQVHSENSDGTATIEEMARAAKEFGLDYVAITDHTKSLALAGGLDGQELLDQAGKIAELNDRWEDFRVLASAEVNIMKDGSLDIPDNVLDKLDIVGAAFLSHFYLSVESLTDRLTKDA